MSNQMTVTDTQKVFEIDCDVDLSVPDDGKEWHVTELLYYAGLQQPKKHRQGLVTSGKKYNVKMIAIVIELPDVVDEEEIREVSKSEG